MWQWNDGTCELYHYGVKGMKWGVRRNRSMIGKPAAKKGRSDTRYEHRPASKEQSSILDPELLRQQHKKRIKRVIFTIALIDAMNGGEVSKELIRAGKAAVDSVCR